MSGDAENQKPRKISLSQDQVAILQLSYQRIGQAQAVLQAQQEDLQIFQQWILGQHQVQDGQVRFDLDQKVIVVERQPEKQEVPNA